MNRRRSHRGHWKDLVAQAVVRTNPQQEAARVEDNQPPPPAASVGEFYRRYFVAHRLAWLTASLVVLAICLLAGRGRNAGRPGRVAVWGQVLLQGQPVASGSINFYPAEGHAGPAANAGISQGRYEFSQEDGPFAGPHHVVVAFVRDANDEAQFAKTNKARQSPAVAAPASDTEPRSEGTPASPPAVSAPAQSHTQEFDIEVPAGAAPRLDLQLAN